ncbi:PIN domain-like protein [Dendrothele bispora CBS 962.96]|uniref:PIN domain-like protein n=1 Tax=Dendrothele bispora (strain CBS 962.96) TaxID=1314807 RepID=A0A4S8KS86_DENBC|nr:PIN domain-like protein [Dendrothele bispora CBS 962.96]
MGIRDLWTIVSPSRQLLSLQDLSYQHFHDTGKYLVVGVDMSIWFATAQMGLKSKNITSHAQLGQNPELRNIFQRLSRMSTLPIALVAVFDGPGRPSRKRNTAVSKTPHWMTKRSQEILRAFGYHYYMAPGEAEAELAYLNRSHRIDAVLTDDSDVLVFGATWVIRNPHDKTDLDKVYSYKASDFETQATTPIMRDGLLLFAVLRGGDYEKGLNNCGKAIAYGLTQTSLGSRLRWAVDDYSATELRHFLDGQWRDDLVYQLEHDPYAFIGRKNPKLASGIPLHFPDITTVLRYVTPLISTSSSLAVAAGPSAITEIDAQFLISQCMQLFGWENKATATQFRKHVWPSVCTRQLLKGSASHVAGLDSVKRTKTGIALLARFDVSQLCLDTDKTVLHQLWLPATAFKLLLPLVNTLLDRYQKQHQTHSVACKIALLYEAFGQPNLRAVAVSSHPSSIPFIVDLTEESDDDVETAGQDEVIDLTACE